MTDNANELTASDGLCDVFLEFEGMQMQSNSPHGDFTFRFVYRKDGHEKIMATMSFHVLDAHDGFPGMMARAYDQMVTVLRQSLYTSVKMRNHYRIEASKHYPRHR